MMHIEASLERMLATAKKLEEHMGKVADALAGIPDALNTAKDAIVAKIGDLESQIAAGGALDADDNAALQAVKDSATGVEGIVPAPAPVPPTA